MDELAKKYLNKLIPNNWDIVILDDGNVSIYTRQYSGSGTVDLPDVEHAIRSFKSIPYIIHRGASFYKITIESKDLIEHKVKTREDKINSILNEKSDESDDFYNLLG